jgi:hypothetical protein
MSANGVTADGRNCAANRPNKITEFCGDTEASDCRLIFNETAHNFNRKLIHGILVDFPLFKKDRNSGSSRIIKEKAGWKRIKDIIFSAEQRNNSQDHWLQTNIESEQKDF